MNLKNNRGKYGTNPFNTLASKTLVDLNTGCWIWTGLLDKDGYGKITVSGKNWRTHRWTYSVYRESLCNKLVSDHLCRNRSCCNPWHIEQVTNRTNILRGNTIASKKYSQVSCKRGHALIKDNIYWHSGTRACVRCMRASGKVYRFFKKTGIKKSLDFFLCISIVLSQSCVKNINPPIEKRVFFPEEVQCKILENGKTEIFAGVLGSFGNDFMVVGLGRWIEDQNLLDECEKKALIKRK